MKNETSTSSQRLFDERAACRSARRGRGRSSTMTLRRSNRSTMTPPSVARKKPGSHADADDEAERGRRVVRDLGGRCRGSRRSPTQSPRLENTCASQSLKNGREPKSRHGRRRDRVLLGRGRDERCGLRAHARPQTRPAVAARRWRVSRRHCFRAPRVPPRWSTASPSPSSRRRWSPFFTTRVVPSWPSSSPPSSRSSSWPASSWSCAWPSSPGPSPRARAAARPPPRSVIAVGVDAAADRSRWSSPSVTYGPKRPSSTRTGFPVSGLVAELRRSAAWSAGPGRAWAGRRSPRPRRA